MVFVRKLMFLKYICQKTSKENCARPVFLEEVQAARNCSNILLHFNKIPNSLGQIFQTYPEICIFVCYKKWSDWSQSAWEILWSNLMTMWWNSCYSKFGSEIWRWLGNILLGTSFFRWCFNFLQMLWLYSSVNKESVI